MIERYAIALDDPKISRICRKAVERQMDGFGVAAEHGDSGTGDVPLLQPLQHLGPHHAGGI